MSGSGGVVRSSGDAIVLHQNGSAKSPTTPNGDVLSKFEVAKTEMIQHFVQLQNTTKALAASFKEFSGKSSLNTDINMDPMHSAIGQIDHIKDVISRDQMKVVFFGRTSSGKSTVSNAILRGKILPVGMGDTTNCFITMQGTNQPEPYMIHPLHPETPQSVHSVAQLAHALDKNKLQRSSQLMIFWPSDRVDLLQHDIQLIDSPGISVDIKTDTWIDKYCLDADVFIFVANAESTIMETEKQFFYKVSQHLSKPNMFILQNKWDLADCSDVDPSSVRQQHVERSIEFLIDELKVMDDALEAEKRVFFISAKEELNFRIQESKGQPVVINGEYKEAIEERRREFKNFEADFKFCVCDSAIKTKFEKHTQKGLEIMSSVKQMLQSVTDSAKLKRSKTGEEHTETVKQYKQMKTRAKKLDAFQREELTKFGNQVQAKIETVMGGEVLNLTLFVEKFPQPFPGDPSGLPQYKKELFDYIDQQLKSEVDKKYHQEIVTSFDQLRMKLIENAEQIISESWVKKQPKPVALQYLRVERVTPELNFSVSCNSLCSAFREDLNFNFSLGFSNLFRKLAGPMKSRHMMRKAADAARSGVTRHMSGEAAGHGDGSSGGNSCNQDTILLPLMTSLSVLPSMGPFGLVIAGGIIWSKINWKVIVVVGGVYGCIYLYERLTWNVIAKQKAFKRQVVDFAIPQLSSVIPMISHHCSETLTVDVQNTYSTLKVDVDAALADSRRQIEACEATMKSLNEVIDISATYIAKIHGHEKQFAGFLQRFLQTGH